MFWVVITVLLGLIGAGALIVALGATESGTKTGAAAVAGLCAFVWIVATIFASGHLVGEREVGVVRDFSGAITGKVDKGVSWTAPWQDIQKENIGIQREEFALGSDNSAVSKDQQPIFAKVTVNYQVDPEHVVDLYKRVGPGWKHTLLDSRVLQDFKEVTAGFTAQEITTNRSQLRSRTRTRLSAELRPYDVRVVDFFVSNIGYSDAYSESIEAKNRQVQAALQAEAKIRQVTAEADQKIETAKGEKNSAIQRATGEAESIRLTGRALRNNPDVLRLRAIEKLSEQATVVICTADRCPSFLPTTTRQQP